ncbi:MAG: methyltransferase domain-containing protein [Chloroflexi bacterium]|nr:methyltransferase domain-containing protein [Chloroflexota bacterium]
MRRELIENLRCPDCGGSLHFEGAADSVQASAIEEGSLACRSCGSLHAIERGIPVLLPKRFSNTEERELRKRVSEQALRTMRELEGFYDRHHFRTLAYSRIKKALGSCRCEPKPRVLDIGIGWGINYLPFAREIDLVGLDFSFESLLVLKSIYEAKGLPAPDLVCGSLSALPLENLKFDVVWSTQVYQHVPDAQEIESSFDYVVRHILAERGRFVVDSLNYCFYRFPLMLKGATKRNGAGDAYRKESWRDELYLKYYTPEDFAALARRFEDSVYWKIGYTEAIFHPEFGFTPTSRVAAVVDSLVQGTPLGKYISRQISLTIQKRGAANG